MAGGVYGDFVSFAIRRVVPLHQRGEAGPKMGEMPEELILSTRGMSTAERRKVFLLIV